ncbi:MAG: hypothetical protein ABFD25_03915 [Clostridiaceae bacterium]
MAIAHVNKEDIVLKFKNGFAQTEMLAGTYKGGVHAYRCALKSGRAVTPEIYPKTLQIFCLTDGKGAIITPDRAYAVNEVSFYVADPASTFAIHAATDMVYTMFVVEQTVHDLKRYDAFHLAVPFFQPLSECVEYCQDCKTANSKSFSVIPTKRLCRVLMGVAEANGEKDGTIEGTSEIGHPAVAQWNVLYGDTELTLTVDGESIDQKSGDFSYVPAGLDHSLLTKPGKNLHYIWFEHYVQEVDYLVSNPHR